MVPDFSYACMVIQSTGKIQFVARFHKWLFHKIFLVHLYIMYKSTFKIHIDSYHSFDFTLIMNQSVSHDIFSYRLLFVMHWLIHNSKNTKHFKPFNTQRPGHARAHPNIKVFERNNKSKKKYLWKLKHLSNEFKGMKINKRLKSRIIRRVNRRGTNILCSSD